MKQLYDDERSQLISRKEVIQVANNDGDGQRMMSEKETLSATPQAERRGAQFEFASLHFFTLLPFVAPFLPD